MRHAPQLPMAAILALLFAGFAAAQNPRLVDDLHQFKSKAAQPLDPRDFVEVNGTYYFVGDEDGIAGLYATAGTEGTTRLVPFGRNSGPFHSPRDLTAFGKSLVFTADGHGGRELWVVRPTGSAELVADIRSGPDGSDPGHIVFDGQTGLLFAADDGFLGRELWFSDGTTTGTRLVRDIRPGPLGSDPAHLAYQPLTGWTWFAADSGAGRQPWRSDGSSANTVRGYPLMSLPDPTAFRAFGQYVYFVVGGGLARGTSTNVSGVGVLSLRAFGLETPATGTDQFLVGGEDPPPNSNPGLWVVTGGPVSRVQANVDCLSSGGARLGASDRAVFEGSDPRNTDGYEPWVGGSSGASQLLDIYYQGHSYPRHFVSAGNRVYFTARHRQFGRELWVTDGTTTTMVDDLRMGPSDGVISKGIAIGSDLLFSGGRRLYRTDGTPSGTRPVEPTGPNPDSSPDWFATMHDAVLFSADRGGGKTLLTSRGTVASTAGVGGVVDPRFPCSFGDKVYFTASGKLYESDGTTAGTTAKLTGSYEHLARVGSRLVFVELAPYRLHTWDRAGSPILLLTDSAATAWTPGFTPVGTAGSFVFAGAGNTELWISDGTAAGTRLLEDLHASGNGYPQWLTAFGGRVVFSGDDGTNGRELWISDGTAAGTLLLKDLAPGAASSSPHSFAVLGSACYFFANGDELWKTDGTAAGTVLVADLGVAASSLGALTAVGSRHLVFRGADPGGKGVELWISDGTAAGTRLLADVATGSADGLYPTEAELSRHQWSFAVLGNLVFFPARTSSYGAELWVYDNGATAWRGRDGCGTAVRVPALAAGDPVLGTTQQITCGNVQTGAFGVTMLGFEGSLPLAAGCTLWLHPWRPWLPIDAWLQSSGDRVTQLAIPDSTSLIGLRLGMQALVTPTNAPHGFDLSNSVNQVLGR